jgi:hypothetical protein
MKKITACLMTTLMLLAFLSTPLKAITTTFPITTATTPPIESAAVNALMIRLGEIKAMDKSNLSSSEKKQLRKETRTIKRELRKSSGGIYFSVGAIIVILVLLILLLK